MNPCPPEQPFEREWSGAFIAPSAPKVQLCRPQTGESPAWRLALCARRGYQSPVPMTVQHCRSQTGEAPVWRLARSRGNVPFPCAPKVRPLAWRDGGTNPWSTGTGRCPSLGLRARWFIAAREVTDGELSSASSRRAAEWSDGAGNAAPMHMGSPKLFEIFPLTSRARLIIPR
jgi:hypothetical protein